jgi:hypothetical protein
MGKRSIRRVIELVWAIGLVFILAVVVNGWTPDQVAAGTLIVAVLALLAAILAAKYAYDQLVVVRAEQVRIADALSRRAVINVGFVDAGPAAPLSDELVLTVVPPAGASVWDGPFTMRVRNCGDATARDMHLDVEGPFSSGGWSPGTLVVGGSTRNPEGTLIIPAQCAALNPGEEIVLIAQLALSATTPSEFTVRALITLADAEPLEFPLSVRLAP